ncbi:type VI secretion system contractile sheath large subunit [Sphingomonas sp. 37zxx]|uniref:type VI secretion system contractile sheath large subunit n=1 Tax=Sphingomonas sp. 37zxx TaxID=1550073 RepID=UPI000B1B7F0B|nr:type VI secretion system contractile sheath large subunit [Sphingomonas sp. 37zxx]
MAEEMPATVVDYLETLRIDPKSPEKINGLQMIVALNGETELTPAKQDADAAPRDLVSALQHILDRLDEELSAKLDLILHDPAFQQLEATWRGLHHLVFKTETSTRLKLRVLDATEKELRDDLGKAIDFDQSALFKKVYEEEYGTLGGKPYGLLVGDYYFDRSAPSQKLLRDISQVAAAAHAPFIGAADPKLFDLDSFQDLPKPRDLSKIFDSVVMAEWRAFRETEESRYATLTLPRVLMRLPYDPVDNPVDGIDYSEYTRSAARHANGNGEAIDVSDPVPTSYLWGNPAWFLAQRITNAFALYSWTAAIRGVEGGGKVESMPLSKFLTAAGETAIIIPTEVSITDRREKELSDLGFVSLVYCKGENYAAFFGAQTVNKPQKYNLQSANSNAELSARLPYILNTSRFAHYIKVMMRDRIGSFMTKENVQSYLTTWISDYVLDKDDAGQDLKARYPLREARIDVSDVPGQPGSYNATVFLRPHFQLEGLSASLRLVAELPAPVAA